jgi:hypothetical protein
MHVMETYLNDFSYQKGWRPIEEVSKDTHTHTHTHTQSDIKYRFLCVCYPYKTDMIRALKTRNICHVIIYSSLMMNNKYGILWVFSAIIMSQFYIYGVHILVSVLSHFIRHSIYVHENLHSSVLIRPWYLSRQADNFNVRWSWRWLL